MMEETVMRTFTNDLLFCTKWMNCAHGACFLNYSLIVAQVSGNRPSNAAFIEQMLLSCDPICWTLEDKSELIGS